MNSGYRCLTAFLMIVLALGLGACAGEAERTGWPVYESEPAGDSRGANVIPGLQRATGFGSVHDVPRLPTGFTDVFESWYVEANGIRLHAVIGGEGRPLLLLAGWPQNWFAWRYLMLPLAKQFSVIAVDPRGVGLSDKATSGYDSKTLAVDMFALMSTLGHEHFAMVGHDIGMWTGYAMAADQPGRIERIALGEAIIPGVSPSPPLLSDDRWLSDFLWHFNFNRALEVNERLVEGREEIYFGHQFATKAGSPEAVPAYAREFYIDQLKRDREALRASFDYYRAIDQSIPQNRERMKTKVTIPILAFSGALASGDSVGKELGSVGTNVQSVIIEGSGLYPAEEKPEVLLKALQSFFSPYAAGRRMTDRTVTFARAIDDERPAMSSGGFNCHVPAGRRGQPRGR